MTENEARTIWNAAYSAGFTYGQNTPSPSANALQKRRLADFQKWLVHLSMKHANATQALPRDPITGALVVPLFGKKGE